MIDHGLLEELDHAAGEMKASEDRFRGICRRISEDGLAVPEESANAAVPDPTAPDPTADVEKKHTGGRGRRRTVEGDPAADAEKQYWKKVTCTVCREILGSRVYKDIRYPVLHRNPDTGEPCKGSLVAGAAIGG